MKKIVFDGKCRARIFKSNSKEWLKVSTIYNGITYEFDELIDDIKILQPLKGKECLFTEEPEDFCFHVRISLKKSLNHNGIEYNRDYSKFEKIRCTEIDFTLENSLTYFINEDYGESSKRDLKSAFIVHIKDEKSNRYRLDEPVIGKSVFNYLKGKELILFHDEGKPYVSLRMSLYNEDIVTQKASKNINFTLDEDNKEFLEAVDIVLNADSIMYLTGKAGTGKTTFLKYIRSVTTKNTVVLAPTGIAAHNAGGQTIHSFFNLPFSPFVPNDSRLNTYI